MYKSRICVLIRVYNRIEDLTCNLDIIRKTWTLNDYYIIIVSNGKTNGYNLPDKVFSQADKVLELDQNDGHYNGNSQLLIKSIPYIPKDCEYTILLESDTWLYTDNLISRYINKMKESGAVWSSARWFYRFLSNATDFAIVNTDYLYSNLDIVNFNYLPECWVSNYLADHNNKYLYIKELMPVQLPTYVKRYHYAPHGRFNVFPDGQMITHHIEDLSGGMDEKKYYFNVISKSDYFETGYSNNIYMELFIIKMFRMFACLFPGNILYSKRKRYNTVQNHY